MTGDDAPNIGEADACAWVIFLAVEAFEDAEDAVVMNAGNGSLLSPLEMRNLSMHCGGNLAALVRGATPSYYVTGVSDGTVNGVALTVRRTGATVVLGPGSAADLAPYDRWARVAAADVRKVLGKDSALVESFIAMMAQQSSPASGAAPFQPSMCISRPFAVVRRSPRQ